AARTPAADTGETGKRGRRATAKAIARQAVSRGRRQDRKDTQRDATRPRQAVRGRGKGRECAQRDAAEARTSVADADGAEKGVTSRTGAGLWAPERQKALSEAPQGHGHRPPSRRDPVGAAGGEGSSRTGAWAGA